MDVLSLIAVGLGALCLLGGLILVVRLPGSDQSQGTIKFMGAEIQLKSVGPGVIFAALGVLLVAFGVLKPPPASRAETTVASATPASVPTAAAPVSPPPTSTPSASQPSPPAAGHTSETPPAPPPGAQPTIAGVVNNGGQNQVNCVFILTSTGPSGPMPAVTQTQDCSGRLTPKEAISRNIDFAISNLSQLLTAKSDFLFPAMDNYRHEPTPANWEAVLDHARLVSKLVNETIESVVRMDPSANAKLGPTIRSVTRNLNTRAYRVHALTLQTQPPSLEQLNRIETEQKQLYSELRSELQAMKDSLTT